MTRSTVLHVPELPEHVAYQQRQAARRKVDAKLTADEKRAVVLDVVAQIERCDRLRGVTGGVDEFWEAMFHKVGTCDDAIARALIETLTRLAPDTLLDEAVSTARGEEEVYAECYPEEWRLEANEPPMMRTLRAAAARRSE
jgi:hypothetical protein